jgi:hypothetical protein
MNIDELTIGQVKQLHSMLFAQPAQATNSQGIQTMIGKKCIIRTYSAGVWFGEIAEKSGTEVIVKNARRMWTWWAAKSISLSGVALYGIKHDKSRIAPPVESVWLDAIELTPTTDESTQSIEGAPHAEAQ